MGTGIYYFLLILILFVVGKDGPTDRQLKELRENINKLVYNREIEGRCCLPEELPATLKLFLQNESGKYDINKLSLRQLKYLPSWTLIEKFPDLQDWLNPSLKRLSNEKNDSAVIAKFYLLTTPSSRTYGNYKEILAGSCNLLLQTSNGREFVKALFSSSISLEQKAELAESLVAHVDNTVHENVISALLYDGWYRFVHPNMASLPKETKDKMRATIHQAYEQRLPSMKLNKEVFENDYKDFQGAYAQGILIGGEAPELGFLWTSQGNYRKLSDLRGKIVVVDFWATWCGPCVRAFPNVRKLQERYKDYDVVIIGVTSVQGRHIDRSGEKSRTIDVKGNPQKEFQLMRDFMRDLDMTWTVAFSEQNVFNAEYGVKGIPHIVIIDAKGRVRYNEISPYSPPYEEAEKIDLLLKEAGLKCPLESMEKKNYVEEFVK